MTECSGVLSAAFPGIAKGMQIAFRTKMLRDTCEDEKMLTRKFGQGAGAALKRRLADLRAATSITDVVLGDTREVPRTGGRAIRLDFGDGYHLIFEANHARNPSLADGKVDWSAVSRIKVTAVEKDDG